jgi:hypothetical protein
MLTYAQGPVARRVHTSSVLLSSMLHHARGSDALSLEDSVLEGGPNRFPHLSSLILTYHDVC